MHSLEWVEYFAVKDKSALCIAECFVDEILMRHGAPKVLISDGGREFNNQILKAICKLLKIRKITTAPYNPRADGLAENQVKTCKDMLSSYCNVYQNDWDKYLSVVAHYYRTTVNEATGMSPYRALYGRECIRDILFN
jgi:transposase InsO family protein